MFYYIACVYQYNRKHAHKYIDESVLEWLRSVATGIEDEGPKPYAVAFKKVFDGIC